MDRARTSRHRQRGLSGFFIAVILILAAVAIGAFAVLARKQAEGARGGNLETRFARIDEGLRQFVSVNARLPCPANPTLDTGAAAAGASPTFVCTSPAGTVPWQDIGIAAADALDPWGNKISYRISTAAGSLAQANGASMTDCDTVEPLPTGTAGGACRSSHDTTPAQYLAGKGLAVNDNGTAVSDAAYVLVSHGPSGFGGYTAAGVAMAAPANVDELANTSVGGSFIARPLSTQAVPGSSAYFDDTVHYSKLQDLIHAAGRDARDWPDIPPTPLTAANIAIAMNAGSVAPGDLGTSSINFGTFTTSTSGGNLALVRDVASGTDGLGVAGLFGGYLNNIENNSIVTLFSADARIVGITLASFGTSFGYAERVQLLFRDASGTVVDTVTKSACNPDGGLASFSVTSTNDFRSVEVRPISSVDGSGNHSLTFFTLAEVRACQAASGSCPTSLATTPNTCV